jgi:hypothetical protein
MDIQTKKLELFDLILRTDKMPVLGKIFKTALTLRWATEAEKAFELNKA